MHVRPEIAALRSDKAKQARLRDAMDAAQARWRARPQVAQVLADLKCYAAGAELDSLARLNELLGSFEHAEALVAQWCRDFLGPLRHEPLAQVPLRHHYGQGFATMQLASEGGAALSLAVYEEKADFTPPRSAVFSDRELHELVLAGSGGASIHQVRGGHGARVRIESERRALRAGSRLAIIGGHAARQIGQVAGQMVILQLTRVPDRPGLTREYAIPSGELPMQSSGDKRASQCEMAMAVLGAMERRDAAGAIAEMAQSGPDHLRWEALRHTLALDSGRGMRRLERIASEAGDPLAEPARRLHAQLLAAHPQLADREAPCPA
ncbi:hypothetical protein [Altererythrobacter litoralis]|uniref:Uncharacterized protein n=1 Tax=Altererythrobacter litoralis TaxID=3113904 RepID=A0ABU7GFT7_9SPHN|nr:hypothetical protein [Erythrobacteraceae bacterium 1XM1-14]